MAKRSKVISIGILSKSIDKAVELAAKRHGVTIGGETVIRDWEILGRVIRDLPSRGIPLDVAVTIAKGAKLKGTPVAAKIGKEILVGVIPLDLNVNIGS